MLEEMKTFSYGGDWVVSKLDFEHICLLITYKTLREGKTCGVIIRVQTKQYII